MYLSNGLSLRMNIPICAFDPEVKPKVMSYKCLGMDDKDLGRADLFWAPHDWHEQKLTGELRLFSVKESYPAIHQQS